MTLARINERIRSKVSPHVELVRGDGYHYFVFDDGKTYESESVMVPYTNMMQASEWLEIARGFAAKQDSGNTP